MRQFVLAAALIITVVLSISACDSSGISGSAIVDDRSEIVSDTLYIENIFSQDIPGFSGGKTYLSAGKYNDALMGEFTFTALMQPSLNRTSIDTISEQATAKLVLDIHSLYGDTLSTLDFKIVEIDRRWRANAWRLDSIPPVPSLLYREIGTASVDGNNEFEADLDPDWLQEYRTFFYAPPADRDSDYRNSFFGFALVPQNDSKVISFTASGARLKINNHLEADTTYSQTMRAWAYSKQHVVEEPDETATSSVVFNNFKNVYVFSIDVIKELQNKGDISRAELVLYQDSLAMQQTLEPNHSRNTSEVVRIFMLNEAQTTIAVTDQESFSAIRRASDGTWRINLTSYFRAQLSQSPDIRNYYLQVGLDDGRFQSQYIHNHLSPDRSPKVLITRIKPSGI